MIKSYPNKQLRNGKLSNSIYQLFNEPYDNDWQPYNGIKFEVKCWSIQKKCSIEVRKKEIGEKNFFE